MTSDFVGERDEQNITGNPFDVGSRGNRGSLLFCGGLYELDGGNPEAMGSLASNFRQLVFRLRDWSLPCESAMGASIERAWGRSLTGTVRIRVQDIYLGRGAGPCFGSFFLTLLPHPYRARLWRDRVGAFMVGHTQRDSHPFPAPRGPL